MDELDAFAAFYFMRWGDGPWLCPKCGQSGHCYVLERRSVLSCSKCNRQSSITSGSVFHATKMTLKQCVTALAIWVDTNGRASSADYVREMKINFRTADVLRKKLDETYNHELGPFWMVSAQCGYFQKSRRTP